MTHGAVRVWLTLEGLVALAVALWFYAEHRAGWGLFACLFLVPDLSLADYLAGLRAGARAYNLVPGYAFMDRGMLHGLRQRAEETTVSGRAGW